MRQFSLFVVVVCAFASNAIQGAILYYSGVALEKPSYQEVSAPIKHDSKERPREKKETYLGLIELSRYEIHLVFPTVAKFLALITQHSSIKSHIATCLGLDLLRLEDFLHTKYNHEDQHHNFVSLEDITPYLQHPKSDPSYCFAKAPGYPISLYQDFLEIAESRWKVAKIDRDVKSFLTAGLRFLDFYESLGNLFRSKIKSPFTFILGSSDRHYLKHLEELEHLQRDSSSKILLSWQRAHDLLQLQHGTHAWKKSLASIQLDHSRQMAEVPNYLKRHHIALTPRQKLFQDLVRVQFKSKELVLHESLSRILDRIKTTARNATSFYIDHLTDDVADNIEDHRFNLTLAGIEPMDKTQYLAYRLAKFSDGLLTISITLTGEVTAPLTGGVSGLVSNLAVTGINGFFSFVTSMIRKQKVEQALERALLRTLISGVSNMIPYIGDINDYISGISEINLATGIGQDLKNIFRDEKHSKIIAPEAIGQALVLRLLQERIEWLEKTLIPLGKEIYNDSPLTEKERVYFLALLKKLIEAHRSLVYRSLKASTRYEYLLARGRVPESMLLNVAYHYHYGKAGLSHQN